MSVTNTWERNGKHSHWPTKPVMAMSDSPNGYLMDTAQIQIQSQVFVFFFLETINKYSTWDMDITRH